MKLNWTAFSAGVDNKMDLAPLRTLDDFILQGSRFQVPDINQACLFGGLSYLQTRQ